MKRLHLLCNAHIDPIWQWTWDEGMSSAIATFQSAANLADEFDYIFCHNEAILYQAIEETAPDLFKKIQKLVKQGKWQITGGWYLQPDCLMPSGESFIRQISVGKAYFKEKFGIEPNVTWNMDSFGHSVGLPQILAKNGYVGYISCRPRKDVQFSYPGRFFKWTSTDGSSVIMSNCESYNSFLGGAADKIVKEIKGVPLWMLGSETEENYKDAKGMEDIDFCLWGVGNHGGGPSRKDLQDIKDLKVDGVEIMHSTPEALFSENLNVTGEIKQSLVTVMPGCYSSMARVKQGFRKAENFYYAAEKILAVASLNGIDFNTSLMKKAEEKLLLSCFHDILPGTCIEEGEREGLSALYFTEKVARDFRTKAFLRIVMQDKKAGAGEYPVFVYNYAPYTATCPVEVEFTLADQNWDTNVRYNPHVYHKGVEVLSQQIKEESTLNLDWRKKVLFQATLKPMGITRFDIKVTKDPRESDKEVGACDISKALNGFKPTFEVYSDTADPWGMSEKELKAMGHSPVPYRVMTEQEVKEFCALNNPTPSERIIEDGNVATVYEGIYKGGDSVAVMKYRTYKNFDYSDVKITVEFNDKNKLLRVKIPVPQEFKGGECVGDGPFVFEGKPNAENSFQKWYGVKNKDGKIFAVINDGVYAGKFDGEYIYLTLLRGAGYCFHPIGDLRLYPEDRYLPRIDQGRYNYNLRLYTGDLINVYKLAEEFNAAPYGVNVFPTGEKELEYKRIELLGNVILTNTHKNDKGEYIVRIYNPTEEKQQFNLNVGDIKVQDFAGKGEVVSVVVNKKIANVVHDKMPV